MTWQKVHRCGVVLVAHSTLTVQRLQSCVDHNGLWPRGWNDEVDTHSRTQAASMKVACNWLTHVHQVTGCRLWRQLNISTDSLKSTRCRIGSPWSSSRIVDEMLSNFRFRAISLAAALSTPCSCRRWMSYAPSRTLSCPAPRIGGIKR